jgi:hypothetical protein
MNRSRVLAPAFLVEPRRDHRDEVAADLVGGRSRERRGARDNLFGVRTAEDMTDEPLAPLGPGVRSLPLGEDRLEAFESLGGWGWALALSFPLPAVLFLALPLGVGGEFLFLLFSFSLLRRFSFTPASVCASVAASLL